MLKLKPWFELVREVLTILTLGVALVKGTPLIQKQNEITKDNKIIAEEKLREVYLDKIGSLNKEIVELDKRLEENTSWVGSPSWERIKNVRDMKQEELKRIENIISKSLKVESTSNEDGAL